MFLLSSRLLKEQMGNGKSQETLDSVGLQTSSERGADEQEERTGEGNDSFRTRSDIAHFAGYETRGAPHFLF